MSTPTYLETALQAYNLGHVPVPLSAGSKRPSRGQWQNLAYDSPVAVRETFTDPKVGGVGVLLGEPSGGLIDVDLDHPLTNRLARLVLPETAMKSGRPSTPWSHWWYLATDSLPPGTLQYRLPSGEVLVELRSTGGQTVLPGSTHPEGEPYLWAGEPWGGEEGPRREQGGALVARVATLALVATLTHVWPKQGGRHEAYLALAGTLLRFGDGVHPLWEKQLHNLIGTLAEATADEDGPETRASEVIGSTLVKLQRGDRVNGLPTLARLIGDEYASKVRSLAREIEAALGYQTRPADHPTESDLTESEVAPPTSAGTPEQQEGATESAEDSTWLPIDLTPYLTGEITPPPAGVLEREDGHGLFYPGRVNLLYGASERGKSWVALVTAMQEVERGGTVLYLDFEDFASGVADRLRALGLSTDDAQNFVYVRPDSGLASVSVNRWGDPDGGTRRTRANEQMLTSVLDSVRPTLVIADGMTTLYRLHNLDPNNAAETDHVSSLLRRLTCGETAAVIVIDHVPKASGRDAMPQGSQHKISMVQGTALLVHSTERVRQGAAVVLDLIVGKDRLGTVREVSHGEPQVAAHLTLDATEPGRMRVEVQPPDPDSIDLGNDDETTAALNRIADAQKGIVEALQNAAPEGLSQKAVLTAAGNGSDGRRALEVMVTSGQVVVRSTGRALLHYLK